MRRRRGQIFLRRVNPREVLPFDLIDDFLDKDPAAIEEAKGWVAKNGRKILKARKKLVAHEKVWVDDAGDIFCEWRATEEYVSALLKKEGLYDEVKNRTSTKKELLLNRLPYL